MKRKIFYQILLYIAFFVIGIIVHQLFKAGNNLLAITLTIAILVIIIVRPLTK